jgi:4-hydroxythreonine-4-phosphate dehydrogenase
VEIINFFADLHSFMPQKPLVAITMGDPAGIGPEIVLKALREPAVTAACRPLVIGDSAVLDRTRRKTKGPQFVILDSEAVLRQSLQQDGYPKNPAARPLRSSRGSKARPGQSRTEDSRAILYSRSALSPADSSPGSPSRAGGDAAYRYICAAANMALSGMVGAMATAPISKSILQLAGHNYPGHTELLAEIGGAPECRMMLIGKELRVVPVTGHIAFSKVSPALTVDGIRSTIELTYRGLRDLFRIKRPRIAVAALNPHGGEEGIFGDEEKKTIAPAIRAVAAEGIEAHGPFPADSLFHQAARGDYDAVVCMYHDQGLIPLKLHHFFGGVALTLGPPFIRTSVDHGTAYDIAGKNKADATSMVEAILLAARLAAQRQRKKTR